jgi:hypothetical protein
LRNDAGLAGVTLYGQLLCRDPAANSLGFTVSNAVEARLGLP